MQNFLSFKSLVIIFAIFAATATTPMHAESCRVNKSYSYCIQYKDFPAAAAKQNCSFAGGAFTSADCGGAALVASCEVNMQSKGRTITYKYDDATMRAMSYQSLKTTCNDFKVSGNTVRWIEHKSFNSEEQFPFEEVRGMRRGQQVLAPRDGDDRAWPAHFQQLKTSDSNCSLVSYFDGKQGKVKTDSLLQRFYWEIDSDVECRVSGKFARGKIKGMLGRDYSVEIGGSVQKVSRNDCRSAAPWQNRNGKGGVCTKAAAAGQPAPAATTPASKPSSKKDPELEKLEKDLEELNKPIE